METVFRRAPSAGAEGRLSDRRARVKASSAARAEELARSTIEAYDRVDPEAEIVVDSAGCGALLTSLLLKIMGNQTRLGAQVAFRLAKPLKRDSFKNTRPRAIGFHQAATRVAACARGRSARRLFALTKRRGARAKNDLAALGNFSGAQPLKVGGVTCKRLQAMQGET